MTRQIWADIIGSHTGKYPGFYTALARAAFYSLLMLASTWAAKSWLGGVGLADVVLFAALAVPFEMSLNVGHAKSRLPSYVCCMAGIVLSVLILFRQASVVAGQFHAR